MAYWLAGSFVQHWNDKGKGVSVCFILLYFELIFWNGMLFHCLVAKL